VSAANAERVRGVALTAARSGGRRAAVRSDGPTTQTPNAHELGDELGDAAWLYEWAHDALRPSRDVVRRIT